MNEEKVYLPKDNSEIEKYLNYYITIENPGYAVFLNGPWGSGKTWFIREFKRKNGEDKFVHISLYGVSSIDQITDQVFHQLYPKLTSGKNKIIGKGLKDIAGIFGYSADHIDLKEYLKITSEKILIFDDLERCDSPNLVLGYINRCIEHTGNKVIIIGEEEFLKAKDESFKAQKEKTIGRNFTIHPEFKVTFDFLINIKAHESVKILLQEHYSTVESCFERANCKNLRTLKFCISEFHRFYELLPEKAKKHEGFLAETVNTFFSLCVEIRSGNLNIENIPDIQTAFSSDVVKQVVNRGTKEEVEPDPLALLKKKHFGDGLNYIVPDLNLLYCFFKYGSVHSDYIEEVIESTSYFLEDNTPAWIRFWHLYSITDQDFEKCFKDVLSDFKDFKFTSVGVLSHVVGMLLKYSHDQIIPLNYNDVIKLSEDIVREMTEKKMFEIENDDDFRPFDNSSHGLQFQSLEDSNFKKIYASIKDGSKLKKEDQHKELAAKLPDVIKNNPDSVWSLIAIGRGDDSNVKLYKYPIMKYVDADAFVKALIEMNPSNVKRFTIFHAMKDRYSNIYSYPSLKEDLPWLLSLEEKMKAKIPELKQPTKYQFESLIVNLGIIIKSIKDN